MQKCSPPKGVERKRVLEKDLKKQCIAYLQTIPSCLTTPVSPGQYGGRGVSDLLLCCKGRFVALELKVGSNSPTKLQEKYLKDVRDAGGVGVVCRSLEDVKNIIKEVKT